MAKILIVDDSQLSRHLLSLRLEKRGYQIATATNGREAVSFARTERPDAILMDMMLPELNGVDAARLIRSDPTTEKIPIIAMTGGDVDEGNAKIFDGVHLKSNEFDELTRMLETLGVAGEPR